MASASGMAVRLLVRETNFEGDDKGRKIRRIRLKIFYSNLILKNMSLEKEDEPAGCGAEAGRR
jgi:hypothetical protein